MDNPPIQGPVFLIEVDKIKSNPHQPRRNFEETALNELANSIREFGILQPLVVTKLEKETETGTEVEYQLIAGERRWLAAKLVGLERVPAIIRSVNLDRERLELAIIENVQRADLDPIETARAYAKLQDQFSLTQREIAARIGKSREVVANNLRLLNLPTPIQEAVSKGTLSESQARLLLTVPNIEQQQLLFEEIVKRNLSVRELKSRIKKIQDGGNAPVDENLAPSQALVDPQLIQFQRNLEEFLGAKVKLEHSGSTGKITIAFYSPEELHGIMDRLRELTPSQENPLEGISPME